MRNASRIAVLSLIAAVGLLAGCCCYGGGGGHRCEESDRGLSAQVSQPAAQ